MTTQGAEVHINDGSALSRCVSLVQPVRRDERILKAQRERDTLAVAGSAKRHPVAADRHISRPVHQEIQSPSPSVYDCHAVPNLGRRLARNGQNAAGVIGSTLIARNFPHARHVETVLVCHNLFSDCSGPASSLTAPIGLPVIPPQDPTGTAVTAASGISPQPEPRGGDLLRPS